MTGGIIKSKKSDTKINSHRNKMTSRHRRRMLCEDKVEIEVTQP